MAVGAGRTILNGVDARGSSFAQMIDVALRQSGFMPPARGEVRALIFEASGLSAHVSSAETLLDAVEAERARRLRFDRDRDRYVIAHAVWRLVLAKCLDLELGNLPLVSAPSGQPRLPNTPLSTSLSHSGGWVAVAICGGESVGIDIEQTPPRIRMSDLVPSICTPAEARQLMTLGTASRESALLALWTRKEALLKAFGVGLAEALVTLSAQEGEWVAAPPLAAGLASCRASMLSLPPGLVGALAVPAGITLVGVHQLEPV